jgi:hypothetical protein
LYLKYIVTCIKVLTVYHTWIHLRHHSPLSPLPHSWNSFNRPRFSTLIHKCIRFPPYSLSDSFSLHPPPHTCAKQTKSVLPSCSLFLKKRHFCLYMIASLWHFHVHRYYKPNWFLSIFLLSTLAPFFFYYIIVVMGVHCDIYKSSYNISWLNSPPPSFSFILLPPIPRIVSTGLIFPFSYVMNTLNFQYIHPPKPFPYILSLPTGPSPDKACFIFLFSTFEEKNGIFVCFR